MANEKQWASTGFSSSLADAMAVTDVNYDNIPTANATLEKANKLIQSKATKQRALGGKWDQALITGIDDGDTVTLANGEVIRVSDPLYRFDSVEKAEKGNWLSKAFSGGMFNNWDGSKSEYSEAKQREQVAMMLGKDSSQVTMQDLADWSNMQKVQATADLLRSPGEERWIAPFVSNAVPTNLSGSYVDEKGNTVKAPLNIPVGVQRHGKDMYGRTLSSLANLQTQENVTRQHAKDPRMNAFAPGVPQPARTEEWYKRLPKAAASGGIQLVAGISDAAFTGLAEVLKYGAEKVGNPELYNEEHALVVGYDPKTLNTRINKGVDFVKNGNIYAAAKSFGSAGAEAFFGSLPYMAVVTKAAPAIIMSEFNDSMEAFYENNPGKEPTVTDMARMLTVDTVKTLIERIPFVAAIKGQTSVLKPLEKVLNGVPPSERKGVIKALLNRVRTVGLNIGEEGLQEGAQYTLDYLNREYGTAKDKGFSIDEFIAGVGTGMGAGGFAGTVGQVKDIAMPGMGTSVSPQNAPKPNDKQMQPTDKETVDTLKASVASSVATLETQINDIDAKAADTTDEAELDTLAKNKANLTTRLNTLKDSLRNIEETDSVPAGEVSEAAQATADEFTAEEVETMREKAKTGEQSVDKLVAEAADSVWEAQVASMGEEGKTETVRSNVEKLKAQTKEALKKRVIRMGMTNTMAEAFKTAGISIETTEGPSVSVVPKSNIKDTRTSLLEDEAFIDSVTKGDNGVIDPIRLEEAIKQGATEESANKIINRIRKLLLGTDGKKEARGSMDRLVTSIVSNNKALTAFNAALESVGIKAEGSDKAKKGKALRAAVLALKNVYSTLESEANVAKKRGLKENEAIDDLQANTYTPNQVGRAPLAPQIGKDFLNSYGVKLRGKAEAITAQYTKIGNSLIDALASAGYVDISKEGVVPIPKGMVTAEGGPLKGINTKFVGRKQGKGPVAYIDRVVSLTTNDENLKEVVSTLSNAMLPSNYEMVTTEHVMTIPTHDSRSLQTTEEDIMVRYNALKHRMKPAFIKFFEQIENSEYAEEMLRSLLGTKYAILDYFKENVSGFNRAREDKLKDILTELKSLKELSEKGGYRFNHMSAINHRMHIMQTILDYQGDKFLARNIQSGGEYTTGNYIETDIIVNEVAEDLKVSREFLLDNKPASTPAEKNVQAHIEAYKRSDGFIYIIDSTIRETIPGKYKAQAFRWLDLVKTASEIQDTYNKEKGTIRTDFMANFDSTASGPVNTLTNLSGFKSAQNLVKTLKVKVDGETTAESIDPYLLVDKVTDMVLSNKSEGAIAEFVGNVNHLLYTKVTSGGKEKIRGLIELVKRLNPSTEEKKALRDLVKYALMPWFYGQKEANTANTMAKSLAEELITKALDGNSEAIEEINKHIKGKSFEGGISGKITEESRAELTKAQEILKSGNYIVVDTETTGTDTDRDSIIQFGYTRYKDGNEVESGSIYVPLEEGVVISEEAAKVHNITAEALSDKVGEMTREEALGQIKEVIGNNNIVGHNLNQFDLPMLEKEGIRASSTTVDTIALARSYREYGTSKLSKIAKDFGVEVNENNLHDAEVDTQVTGKVFNKLVKEAAANQKKVDSLKSEKTYPISSMQNKDIEQLIDGLSEAYTSSYVDLLPLTFPQVASYRKFVGKVYALLDSSDSKWDGTVVTPFQVVHGETGNSKLNMSVKKDKQKFLGVLDGDGTPLITTEAMNNQISLSVNLQHAIDAYLELMGLDAAMRVGDKEGALQAIFDSIKGAPNKLIASKVVYEKESVNIAKDYDFIYVLELAFKQAFPSAAVSGSNSFKTRWNEYLNEFLKANGIEGGIAEYKQNKQDFLNSIETDLFGQSVDMEAYNKLKARKIAGSKSKTNTKKPKTPKSKPKEPSNPDKLTALSATIRAGNVEALVELLNEIESTNISETHKNIITDIVRRLSAEDRPISVKGGDTYKSESIIKGGTRKVTINLSKDEVRDTKYSIESMIETIGHEVEHAATNEGLVKEFAKQKADRDINLNFIVDKVLPRIAAINTDEILNPILKARIKYLQNPVEGTDNIINRVAELLAITRNEPEMANNIMKRAFKVKSKKNNIWQRALNKIREFGEKLKLTKGGVPKNSLENAAIAINTLSLKLELIGEIGSNVSIRSQMTAAGRNRVFDMINSFTEWQNSFVRGLVMAGAITIKGLALPLVKYAHGKVLDNSTIYARTVYSLAEGMKYSPFINDMKRWLKITDNYTKEGYNKILQMGHTANRETNTIYTSVMPGLTARLEKVLSKSGMKAVNSIFAKTDLYALSQGEYLNKIVNEEITIDEAVKELEKSSKFNKEEIDLAKAVAKYYITGKVATTPNLDVGGKPELAQLASLYALKSIRKSQDMLVELKTKTPYLYKELMRYAIALGAQKIHINKDGTESYSTYTDFDGYASMDVYDDQHDFELVTASQMRSSKYSEEEGWIKVREATANTIGIVAKKRIDGQFTPGIGLNSNRFYNGIILDRETSKVHKRKADKDKTYLERNNMLLMNDGRIRVVLLTEEKEGKLGLKQNVAQSLLRAYAHNEELLAMNAVRKVILTSPRIRAVMGVKELEELDAGIKKNHLKQEMPIFLKVSDIYDSFDKLPTYIKKMYKTPEGISTYNNFNQEISLIRRDMASSLLGYKNIRLFGSEAPMTLQKLEDGFKKLILMMKLKLVILDPLKLSVDAVSNFMYLTGRNIGVDEMYKYGKEGSEAYVELTKLQTMLVKAKLLDKVNSTRGTKARITALEKRIENNKFKKASDYGFVQSYSTELMVKDFDTVSGLQKDIDNIVNKITKEGNEDLNLIGRALTKWMHFGAEKGISVDGLLRGAVALSRTNNTSIGKELINISNRLKSVRDADDVAQYITNIIGGPGSEGVKVGSAFMVGTDALSKYILAKSLMTRINPETGKRFTESEAYLDASAAYLDQRENMPREIKLLSDFTLSFPSFWARINMVIYNMFKTNPVSAFSMAATGEISGINTIMQSNVVNKALNGTMFNFTNPVQPGTIFPIGL